MVVLVRRVGGWCGEVRVELESMVVAIDDGGAMSVPDARRRYISQTLVDGTYLC